MSKLRGDHHGKPGSIGRPVHPTMWLLSSARPQSRPARFESKAYQTGSFVFKSVNYSLTDYESVFTSILVVFNITYQFIIKFKYTIHVIGKNHYHYSYNSLFPLYHTTYDYIIKIMQWISYFRLNFIRQRWIIASSWIQDALLSSQ